MLKYEHGGYFGHGGFFEHGFTRIERMFFCDGVAKLLGKQTLCVQRSLILRKSKINNERLVLIGRPLLRGRG